MKMNSRDKTIEIAEKYDTIHVEQLRTQLEFLKHEKVIKAGFDYSRIKPEYEYEKSAEWIDHLRNLSVFKVEETIAQVENALDDLELKAMEREELLAKEIA